ncbi:MAG: endonuclease IV, partial [Clostridia bacterium]
KICKLWDNFIPCVDFGHLNSRTHGGLKTSQDFEDILDEILQTIGERGKKMHIHFSKIMYGKGGEVKHLTFADTEYGPEFEPLGEALNKLNFDPTIICESAGTQTDDAVTMSKIMQEKFKV